MAENHFLTEEGRLIADWIFYENGNDECGVCGIMSFSHEHKKGTLPKNFVRIGVECRCHCHNSDFPACHAAHSTCEHCNAKNQIKESKIEKECPHNGFEVKNRVSKIEDVKAFIFESEIRCGECKLPFRFVGCEAGVNMNKPTVSVDGLELRVPVEPEIVKKIATKITISPNYEKEKISNKKAFEAKDFGAES